ncbi:stage III sporulation protein AG [Lutispora saccharofermentans]|uniref:Stage III sporulation protein AG n=1 Tax=Lutispora saccharofermentans TaxID=3024236 RepID=A0ABT1NFH3_9FIRM|nr:stage III sporulation protein AG [Lutispora saccharofermentans]MCQ1529824.1 stage III sporulation protein AG [Lutispora saccharofermentans]
MKILEWLKEKFMIDNNKKLYTNIMILLCMGVALVIVANFYNDMAKDSKSSEFESFDSKNKEMNTDYMNREDNYGSEIEKQLSSILSKISGAGKVSVMITYESGKELVTQKDNSRVDKITDEKDTNGGTRVINESSIDDKTVMVNQQGGSSQPIVVKEINPEIKGVIVVAEGARNSKVKLKISEAVQTVLDVPAYRVTVLETNK